MTRIALSKLNSAAEEAANRAEVTAILIRLGYGVYRPEFDWNGEDLIIKTADNQTFMVVQLKSRAYVDGRRYKGKNIWMLFPGKRDANTADRQWLLVPHDVLYEYTKERHGHTAGFKEHDNLSYPSMSAGLLAHISTNGRVLGSSRLRPGSGGGDNVTATAEAQL